jgi:hypothetical protein
MAEPPDEIAQATQVLTCHVFCRQQARDLVSCRERGSLRRHLSGGGRCERELAAFKTCAEANIGSAITALTKIADTKCPAEVAAYADCKSRSMGADCEAEDLASMRCAAIHILRSASSAQR